MKEKHESGYFNLERLFNYNYAQSVPETNNQRKPEMGPACVHEPAAVKTAACDQLGLVA